MNFYFWGLLYMEGANKLKVIQVIYVKDSKALNNVVLFYFRRNYFVLGEDLNLESKSNSRRSSIEDDSNKNSEAKCNHCDQIVKIKYFRQHYIKHIYKELEQFIMREKGVDKKSSKCTVRNFLIMFIKIQF